MAEDPHLGGFVDFAEAFVGSIAMDGDEYVRCNRCGYGGCDVRVSTCGCTLHARCTPLNLGGALRFCPQCNKPTNGLVLFPMSFREIDEAQRTSTVVPVVKNRGRKRKGSEVEIASPSCSLSERRTGRWTNEEMAYCDVLMAKFTAGELPVADGVKLNEFLGSMLKSKQSRLTKKMKNAKLSTKMFQRSSGCLDITSAREFSELEDSFFHSVPELLERAEIKFHMQKEWREQFSRVCAAIGQPLDADSWLSSVEEMDRRASKARDAARMAKRKLMIGVALRADSRNLEQGVFIEKTEAEQRAFGVIDRAEVDDKDVEREMLGMLAEGKDPGVSLNATEQSSLLHSAPFLAKVTSYLQRHNVPFEHVDLWVPSFVPGDGSEADGDQTACRLCYAGNSTTDKLVTENGKTNRSLTADEQFSLFSFGDYSQKFSFNVGCGLPGRVYESGRPTWEQSVHNAPDHHFERCGGAHQWGIKTVLGIPVASPNVGRIVVTLYSCYDRPKDEDLVVRLSEEFTRLMPSPKWKLVVDIGEAEAPASDVGMSATEASLDVKQETSDSLLQSATATASDPVQGKDDRIEEVVALLGRYMPSDPNSPLVPYVPGFMSLRLLLLRTARTAEEEELVRTMLDSFSSYTTGGREQSDIAVMLARDYVFLSQQQQQQQQPRSFLDLGQTMVQQQQQQQPRSQEDASSAANPSGLSLFGLPSTRSSLQNSPALTPIPAPGSIDLLSIVSN